jgi:hypothetical protein
MYWMKAKTARQYPAAFQKVNILLVAIGSSLTRKQCILAYITDLHLFVTLSIARIILSDHRVVAAYPQQLTHLASNEPFKKGPRLWV